MVSLTLTQGEERAGNSRPIQNTQIEFCDTYEYAYMTTTIARTFVSRGLMSNLSHYSQEGYNLAGKEAGLAMAKYVNSLKGK